MFEIIYLHIGLDKTGSKAIQCCCYENTTHLHKSGIFYPITPDTVWHAEFGSFFHENPKLYAYNQAIGRSHKKLTVIQTEDINYIRNLEQKIQQSDAQTMVLSYEGFAFLEPLTLKKMQHYLAGICKRIKVILYCRDPLSYATSAVSQRAISMAPLWDNIPIQDYKNICQKFVSIFGYKNMMVSDFSKNSLFKGDVRKDFFKKIGFNFSEEKSFKLTTSGQNRSLCAEAIMIAVALREHCQQEQISEAEFSWRYAPILQKINGTVYLLSAEQLSQVHLHSQHHLRYLRENFSIDFNHSKQVKTSKNTEHFSVGFIDSIAKIISTCNQFTAPLIPEVKTEQELACQPFIGKLRCLEIVSTMRVNQTLSLDVEIVNESQFNWLSQGLSPTYLSYHWQTKAGENVIFEGLRTPFLDLGLRCGQSLKMAMQLTTPLKKGGYCLILTLVKENVCWFEKNGFKPTKITIDIV